MSSRSLSKTCGSTISRRMLIAGLLGSMAAPAAFAAPTHSIRPQPRPSAGGQTAPQAAFVAADAESILSAARLGGQVSYCVLDGRSGAILESREAGRGQPPASVAKAMTALYALAQLGGNFRFTTRVLATGPIQNGVVQGDLVLLGSGDPSLSTDQLGRLAQALRARGVSGITGRFYVNGAALPRLRHIDRDQPEHVGYNPSISGLNLNYNRVHFEWKRAGNGWQTSVDARGERFVPQVRRVQAAIAARQAPLFTYEQDDSRERWTVANAALGRGGSRWLPVRAPEAYAGEVFQTLCAAQGIRLPEPRLGGGAGQAIAEVQSDDLTTLLRDMLRFSTNLTAEAVGLRASGQSSLAASAAQMNGWLRASYGVEAGFVDHSGLGGGSRISAEGMARILQRSPDLARILRNFEPPSRKKGESGPRVPAKTGTLNFVSGLAGFIDGPRPLVFAIFAADTARRDALRGAERERPQGGPEWTRRARNMQGQLIDRWAALYR